MRETNEYAEATTVVGYKVQGDVLCVPDTETLTFGLCGVERSMIMFYMIEGKESAWTCAECGQPISECEPLIEDYEI